VNLLVLVVGTGLTIVILYLGVRMAATSSQQPTTSKQLVAAFLGGATVAIAVFGAQSLVSETRSERTRRPSSTERLLRRVREEIKRARTSQERMMVQLVLSLEADLSGIDLSKSQSRSTGPHGPGPLRRRAPWCRPHGSGPLGRKPLRSGPSGCVARRDRSSPSAAVAGRSQGRRSGTSARVRWKLPTDAMATGVPSSSSDLPLGRTASGRAPTLRLGG
jgi:hypothetical protein